MINPREQSAHFTFENGKRVYSSVTPEREAALSALQAAYSYIENESSPFDDGRVEINDVKFAANAICFLRLIGDDKICELCGDETV